MALTTRRPRPLDRSVGHLGDTRLLIIAAEGRETERARSADNASAPQGRWPSSPGSHVYHIVRLLDGFGVLD